MKPRALLLHGGPGIPDYLEPVAAELAPVFECERYAQEPHLDIPSFVEEALDHLRAPSWLVGHSWGGRLALEVAAAAPEQLLGLILIGSLGAVGDGGWKDAGPRLTARLTAEERRQLSSAAAGEQLRIIWPGYFADPVLAPPYPGWIVDTETVDAIYAWAQEHAPGNELADAVRSFEQPALLLHGTFDHIPLAAVEATAALLPNAELRVLDGLGHFPWLERPGSIYDEVVDFIPARSS
ncbi:MAG: alpha/beta fold hydrolase [Gaiellaceae bacterium]